MTKQQKPVKSQANKQVEQVTKDSNLGELLTTHPETAEVLLEWGLHCVGCGAMHYDTLETGAKIHGLSDKDLTELIDRLNEVIEFAE